MVLGIRADRGTALLRTLEGIENGGALEQRLFRVANFVSTFRLPPLFPRPLGEAPATIAASEAL
jgi:hypothetical protein